MYFWKMYRDSRLCQLACVWFALPWSFELLILVLKDQIRFTGPAAEVYFSFRRNEISMNGPWQSVWEKMLLTCVPNLRCRFSTYYSELKKYFSLNLVKCGLLNTNHFLFSWQKSLCNFSWERDGRGPFLWPAELELFSRRGSLPAAGRRRGRTTSSSQQRLRISRPADWRYSWWLPRTIKSSRYRKLTNHNAVTLYTLGMWSSSVVNFNSF